MLRMSDVITFGSAPPTEEQIAEWEAIKNIVSPITDRLFVSGYPLQEVQRRMKQEGIDALVSTTQRRPPDLPNVWVIRFPFFDDVKRAPLHSELLDVAEGITEQLQSGRNVLIHCAYGLNRSPLIAAYVLKTLTPFLDGESIFRVIQERRPGSLHNPLFAKMVKAL